MSTQATNSENHINNEIKDIDTEIEIRTKQREARQRKILENAKSRLDKINGRKQHENENGDIGSTTPTTSSSIKTKEIFPDPEIEREDIFEKIPLITSQKGFEEKFTSPSSINLLQNDFLQQTNNFPFNTGMDFMNPNSNIDIMELLQQFTQATNNGQTINQNNINFQQYQQQQSPPDNSLFKRFLKTKLHIIILSLITYLLFITDHEKYISYSVFLPLLLWEITEILLLRKLNSDKSSSPILTIVFLFAGISPIHLNAITKWMEILNKIFKDVGVFMFFFALCHLIYLNGFQNHIVLNDNIQQINNEDF